MEATSNGVLPTSILTRDQVPLRTGPPTIQEIMVYYSPKFTWEELKIFVNSGDLGLLKRDRELQKRYDKWAVDVVAPKYGSAVNYLMNHRLRWGQPDTLSLLKSDLVYNTISHPDVTSPVASVIPPYFSWETPSQFISIIVNDWPYSVPTDIEHMLIWTKMPIYHPNLVAETIKTRIDQDGLWGFTGNDLPPPSPSNLPSCISKLAEWGITMDKMVKSEPPTEEEKILIRRAGGEVNRYVKNRWIEKDWETAWFVNPPRLQSVPDLAHIHVFARRK